MIIVHHLQNSRSQRILWLLEELELPSDVRRYERDPKTMLAPPELRRVHPLGKAPMIEYEGRVVAETGAIVEYLVEKAGGRLGPPPKRDDVLRYRHFLHYAEGSMMRKPAEPGGLAGAHPCPPRLWRGAGARRRLRLRPLTKAAKTAG